MTVYTDLIGIPFEEGGRWPGPRIDCYGIVIEATRRDGHEFPDIWAAIAEAWRSGSRSFDAWAPAGWIELTGGLLARAGDVAVMLDENDSPSHFIYMATNGDALHAARGTTSRLLRLRRDRIVITWRRSAP